ncbi:hypothetical protein GCM10027297_22980 [Parahaliea aestuarii]
MAGQAVGENDGLAALLAVADQGAGQGARFNAVAHLRRCGVRGRFRRGKPGAGEQPKEGKTGWLVPSPVLAEHAAPVDAPLQAYENSGIFWDGWRPKRTL